MEKIQNSNPSETKPQSENFKFAYSYLNTVNLGTNSPEKKEGVKKLIRTFEDNRTVIDKLNEIEIRQLIHTLLYAAEHL